MMGKLMIDGEIVGEAVSVTDMMTTYYAIDDALRARAGTAFRPYEGIVRIDDDVFVSESDFVAVMGRFPRWAEAMYLAYANDVLIDWGELCRLVAEGGAEAVEDRVDEAMHEYGVDPWCWAYFTSADGQGHVRPQDRC